MNNLEYSVLMSVYNGEKPEFLRQSMESILNQTVMPDEYIVVKNGPLTTELDEVLKEKEKQYPNMFTYVKHEENQPLGVALDSGIAVSRNELIARMDSDDVAFPERCEKLIKCFENDPDLSICGTFLAEFYNDDINNVQTIRELPVDDKSIKKFARRRSPFNHCSIMFKKSEVVRCGGYGTSRRKEDLDLFSRMLNMGCKGHNIPEVLMYGRANEASFKRKKSWMYCSDFIAVMKRNWKAGYCSFWDYFVVSTYQILIFILPASFSKFFTNNVLRKKAKGELTK